MFNWCSTPSWFLGGSPWFSSCPICCPIQGSSLSRCCWLKSWRKLRSRCTTVMARRVLCKFRRISSEILANGRNMEKVNNINNPWFMMMYDGHTCESMIQIYSNYDCKSHIIIIIEWTLVCLHAFCIRPARLASTWVQLDGWQWWDLGSNLVAEKGAERVSKCIKGSIKFAATYSNFLEHRFNSKHCWNGPPLLSVLICCRATGRRNLWTPHRVSCFCHECHGWKSFGDLQRKPNKGNNNLSWLSHLSNDVKWCPMHQDAAVVWYDLVTWCLGQKYPTSIRTGRIQAPWHGHGVHWGSLGSPTVSVTTHHGSRSWQRVHGCCAWRWQSPETNGIWHCWDEKHWAKHSQTQTFLISVLEESHGDQSLGKMMSKATINKDKQRTSKHMLHFDPNSTLQHCSNHDLVSSLLRSPEMSGGRTAVVSFSVRPEMSLFEPKHGSEQSQKHLKNPLADPYGPYASLNQYAMS